MFLRFFKQSLPQVLASIIAIAILFWVKPFLGTPRYAFFFDYEKMPFYQIVTSIYSSKFWVQLLICFLALLTTALFLIQLNSKHIIIKHRTYLPALIFVLVCSGIPTLQRINPAVIATLFLIFSFDHIFSIYHKEQVLDNLFKAGFYVAIASLFYAPSLLYIIAVVFSTLSIRTFNIREFIVTITGFITPWFFYSFYQYFVNDTWSVSVELLKNNLLADIDQPVKLNIFYYVFFGYLLLLFMISGLFLFSSLQSQKINVRKYFGVFYWFNLISLIIILFIPTRSIEMIYIVAAPLAYQLSYYFTLSTRKFWPGVLFGVLLVITVLPQFFIK